MCILILLTFNLVMDTDFEHFGTEGKQKHEIEICNKFYRQQFMNLCTPTLQPFLGKLLCYIMHLNRVIFTEGKGQL